MERGWQEELEKKVCAAAEGDGGYPVQVLTSSLPSVAELMAGFTNLREIDPRISSLEHDKDYSKPGNPSRLTVRIDARDENPPPFMEHHAAMITP